LHAGEIIDISRNNREIVVNGGGRQQLIDG
jgi:hypothetical protein